MSIFDGKKTYIGILIAVVPTALSLFGYDVSLQGTAEMGELLTGLVENLEQVIISGGLLIAAYGRLVTKG